MKEEDEKIREKLYKKKWNGTKKQHTLIKKEEEETKRRKNSKPLPSKPHVQVLDKILNKET